MFSSQIGLVIGVFIYGVTLWNWVFGIGGFMDRGQGGQDEKLNQTGGSTTFYP